MILGDAVPNNSITLFVVLGTAGALVLASLAGVFKRGAILGPNRLAEDESPQVVIGVAGVGLLAYGLVYWLVEQVIHGHPAEPQQVAINGGLELAVLLAMGIATAMSRPKGLQLMGIGPSKLPLGLVYGFLSIVIVLPFMLWIEDATERWWEYTRKVPPPAHDLLKILGNTDSPWVKAAIVVIAVGAAPAAEEMFFRGCIQTFLRYAFGRPWLAVLITAALFAMIHPSWTRPPIFFLGICLGYVYERTGNLWASITLHALFNLSSIVIYSHWAH
jgi:membrane protease YdiL (CAAX protease family)